MTSTATMLARKARGECVQCGADRNGDPRVKCARCRAAQAVNCAKYHRTEKGRRSKLAAGKRWQRNHRAQVNAYQRLQRRRRTARGLCQHCPRPAIVIGKTVTTRCKRCLAKTVRRERLRLARAVSPSAPVIARVWTEAEREADRIAEMRELSEIAISRRSAWTQLDMFEAQLDHLDEKRARKGPLRAGARAADRKAA